MRGIFDPFATPKPRLPTYEEAMVAKDKAEEELAKATYDVTLDGGRWALRIQKTTLADVPRRLGVLFLDLQKMDAIAKELKRHGVFLANTVTDANAHHLKTPQGILHVCGAEEGSGEMPIYKRLAAAIGAVSAKPILERNNVTVIQRG